MSTILRVDKSSSDTVSVGQNANRIIVVIIDNPAGYVGSFPQKRRTSSDINSIAVELPLRCR
uniref:hypothetical protein n=1 Tax=Serratia quinivorans TaxID=137545 RepID=UPI0035C69258